MDLCSPVDQIGIAPRRVTSRREVEGRHRAPYRVGQGEHQIYALPRLENYFLREMGTFPPDLFPYLVSNFLFGLRLPLGRIRFHVLP